MTRSSHDKDGHRHHGHVTPHETRHLPRRPGRPRSEAAEKAIVDAVLDLLAEGVTYGTLSVEQIAARAGAGKATLYRRWPNKEALVIDAVASLWEECPIPDLEDDRTTRDRAVDYLQHMCQSLESDRSGLVFSTIMAAGPRHPELVRRYHSVVIEPRREQLRAILRHGVQTGELRADLDIERAGRMLASPIVLLLKGEGIGQVLPEGFVAGLVDDLLRGMGAR